MHWCLKLSLITIAQLKSTTNPWWFHLYKSVLFLVLGPYQFTLQFKTTKVNVEMTHNDNLSKLKKERERESIIRSRVLMNLDLSV